MPSYPPPPPGMSLAPGAGLPPPPPGMAIGPRQRRATWQDGLVPIDLSSIGLQGRSVMRQDGAIWFGPEQGSAFTSGVPGWYSPKGERMADSPTVDLRGKEPWKMGDADIAMKMLGYTPEQTAVMMRERMYSPGDLSGMFTNPDSLYGKTLRGTILDSAAYGYKKTMAAGQDLVARGVETVLGDDPPARLLRNAKMSLAQANQNMSQGRQVGESGFDPAAMVTEGIVANAIIPTPGGTSLKTATAMAGPQVFLTTPGDVGDRGKAAIAATVATPALGGAGNMLVKGISKGVNALSGKVPQGVARMRGLGQQFGVPLTAADESGGTLSRGMEGVLMDVPLSGMHEKTVDKLVNLKRASGAILDGLQEGMKNAKWEGISDVIKAASNPGNKRFKQANKVLEYINNAGEDWGANIQASGNLKVLAEKLKSDHLYEKATQLAPKQNIDPSHIYNTVETILDDIDNVLGGREAHSALYNKLSAIKKDIESGKASDFMSLAKTRTDLAKQISDAKNKTGELVGDSAVSALTQVKDATTDLMDFVASTNPNLKPAWELAKSNYAKNVAPYKDKAISKILSTNSPDEIPGMILSKGVNSDAMTNTSELLGDRGNKALEGWLFNKIQSEATQALPGGEEIINPGMLAKGVKSYSGAIDTISPGTSQTIGDLADLANGMKNTPVTGLSVPTGRQAGLLNHFKEVAKSPVSWMFGTAGTAMGGPVAGAATLGSTIGLGRLTQKALTSPFGKNLINASDETIPSLITMNDFIPKGSGIAGAGAANEWMTPDNYNLDEYQD